MGLPALPDRSNRPWLLDTETGAQEPGDFDLIGARPVPEVWWNLTDGQWVLDTGDDIIAADANYVRTRLGNATRVRRFQDQIRDHLVVPVGGGLQVWSVEWPRWTPSLPACIPQIPETCLSSGRQIIEELSDRIGGIAEAQRHLGIACDEGVFRACYESLSITSPEKSERIDACLMGDLNACQDLSRERYKIEGSEPSPVMMGMLEFTCQMDASGSLGERLRRLEDVGEGCMMLSGAFDALSRPARALLSLDQACVLGRADACEESAKRRNQAFALRTATECEDEAVPVASACVELGQLLQQGPVEATTLDAFDAFLRGCSLGEESGCQFLGDYVDRWGIDNERVIAAEQDLLASCEEGEQRACLGRAYLLVRHEPRSTAYAQSLEIFVSSCEDEESEACVAGARQRRIGLARRVDAPTQVEMWSSACGFFSPEGCAGYGEILASNKRTYLDAFTAWTQACNIGDAHSCTELGRLVLEGHKEPWPGEQPSDDYLSRGCENGDAEGCYWLAADDLPKRGEPPEAAYIMLERSCEGGFGDGCAELASVHLERRTSFDDEIAAGHLDSACESGHYDSCRVLGQMYLRGKGVDRDRDLSREYTERFRVNASRRHLRIGPSIGFPYVAGGAAEVVLPVPVGPAVSFGGTYAYLPVLGTALMFLEGESNPDRAPGYTYWDAVARLYPNNKARGIYGGAGYHVLTAAGGDLTTPLTRSGLSFRIGISNDQKWGFSRVELGLAQYGIIEMKDFDDNETGVFPLIQPVLGVSFGLALL
jgi:TPR repeat protein